MDRITKALHDHDEAFSQLNEVLFGNGADELIAKLDSDKKDKRKEVGRQIGLATNTAGAIAGPAALWQANKARKSGKGGVPRDLGRSSAARMMRSKNPKLRKLGKQTAKGVRWLDKPKGKAAKITAGATGASIVGLQGANWAGDAIAANTLKKPKDDVKKSSPDSADLHSKKEFLPNKRKLMLVAAEQGKKGAPKVVETTRDIKEKVGKSDDMEVVWEGEISKMDTDKRQVFGWASVVEVNGEPVADMQGDLIAPDEIEKAAYEYVVKSRKGGDMHRRNGEEPHHASDMIESMMFTPEKIEKMGLPPHSVPTGWWVGYQVNDPEVWDLVKKGKRTGFSIHGRGKRA